MSREISLSEHGELADLSVGGYTLEEIIKELDLPSDCINDYEVLESYKSGLVHLFLTQKFDNATDEDILKDERITQTMIDEWEIEFEHTIAEEKARVREIDREDARETSSPLKSGVKTLKVMDRDIKYSSLEVIERDARMMVKKLQKGDTTDILLALTTQMMQLQALGNKIATTVSNSNRYDIMSKFQNMQMKTISESRKTIMAINEVCNPKRTTFVKNATQHNHLNSEKKPTIPNELSQPKENIIDAYQYTEAEEITIREDKES